MDTWLLWLGVASVGLSAFAAGLALGGILASRDYATLTAPERETDNG